MGAEYMKEAFKAEHAELREGFELSILDGKPAREAYRFHPYFVKLRG